ncbi:hypothetical protein [Streptomyces lateritius]|uniref:hypothetical protein n=1 Tax=Streptomyces lateritius TaxID=67313 RepID=UPI00167402A9|nr:hypothetical protein [Streptomyces lateritius]GGT67225.1 hypothetical protein GCM10010272_07280 [Streptomyces lateritius]
MRKLATAAVVAGLFLGGAGAAVAAVADSWHKTPAFRDPGVEFAQVKYLWEPKGRNHGGFHFRGTLNDTDHGDGHNVYVEVKVEGYDWNRFKGVQRKKVSLDKVVWDGAAQYTSLAEMRACRDRGTLRPDNCSDPRTFSRKGR